VDLGGARRAFAGLVQFVGIKPLVAGVAANLRWCVKIDIVHGRSAVVCAGETAVVVVVWGRHVSMIGEDLPDCNAFASFIFCVAFWLLPVYNQSMAKTKNDTKRVGCVLPGDLHHRLKVYTTTHKLNMGDWIRNAIHRTLTRAEAAK
jgi:hypothetical protein